MLNVDELTAQNLVLREQIIKAEAHVSELYTWLQRNEENIGQQLNSMHDTLNHDGEGCITCLGECTNGSVR